MEAIVVAIVPSIITGAVAIVVCILNNNQISKNMEAKMHEERQRQTETHVQSVNEISKKMDVFQVMLANLTSEVDKHNHVIERTYELEKKTSILEEQMKVANHRINDVEEEMKG